MLHGNNMITWEQVGIGEVLATSLEFEFNMQKDYEKTHNIQSTNPSDNERPWFISNKPLQ